MRCNEISICFAHVPSSWPQNSTDYCRGHIPDTFNSKGQRQRNSLVPEDQTSATKLSWRANALSGGPVQSCCLIVQILPECVWHLRSDVHQSLEFEKIHALVAVLVPIGHRFGDDLLLLQNARKTRADYWHATCRYLAFDRAK